MKKTIILLTLLIIIASTYLMEAGEVSARTEEMASSWLHSSSAKPTEELASSLPLPRSAKPTLAMLYSAIFPGLGEMYLGDYTRAGIFIGTEILILGSYFRINREVDWKINSYQMYAYRYADVELNSGEDYYRLINSYISSEVYNNEIELWLRNRFIIYEYDPDSYYFYLDRFLIPEEDAWDWESRENWLGYREIRRDKQRLEILANFAIGAAVLNRLISVIDSAVLARRINRESTILSNISIEPDLIRKGYMLSYEFKF